MVRSVRGSPARSYIAAASSIDREYSLSGLVATGRGWSSIWVGYHRLVAPLPGYPQYDRRLDRIGRGQPRVEAKFSGSAGAVVRLGVPVRDLWVTLTPIGHPGRASDKRVTTRRDLWASPL